MPIPKPRKGEPQKKFLSRCMGDDVMVREYEPPQRYAICLGSWKDRPAASVAWHKLDHTTILLHARRVDPSGTAAIRREYEAELVRRFKRIRRQVITSVETNDCFGLMRKPGELAVVGQSALVIQAALRRNKFAFMPDHKKTAEFMRWFRETTDKELRLLFEEGFKIPPGHFQRILVDKSWKKGAVRARSAVQAFEAGMAAGAWAKFLGQTIDQLMKSPFHAQRLTSLYARNYAGLKGISQVMAQQIREVLADGLARGKGPRQIARLMTDRVDKIGIHRARLLARTEVIRANAEAQLTMFEQYEQFDVKMKAEWITAGFGVCPYCLEWEERTRVEPLDITEARGLIPLHPNCRCTWIPVPADGKAKPKPPPEEPKAVTQPKPKPKPKLTPQQIYVRDARLKADKIKSLLNEGEMKSLGGATRVEAMVRDLGKTIRQEVERRLKATKEALFKKNQLRIKKLQTKYDVLEKEYNELGYRIRDLFRERAAAIRAGEDYGHLTKELEKLTARQSALVDEQRVIRKEMKSLEWNEEAVRAEINLEALKDLRSFGGKDITDHWMPWSGDDALNVSHTRAVKTVQEAQNYFPTDWLEMAYKGNVGRPVKVGWVQRGYQSSTRNHIMISGYKGGKISAMRVAVHEMGHAMETAFRRMAFGPAYTANDQGWIVNLEKTIFRRRTQGEQAKWLGKGYEKDELSKFDKWGDKYMGKEYGSAYGSYNAYELVSMGSEALFTPTYINYGVFRNDPEFYEFMLGLFGGI